MKLVYYSEFTGSLQLVQQDLKNPFLVGDSLKFDDGEILGITKYHILMSDEASPPEKWEDAVSLDTKPSLEKQMTLEEENAELKRKVQILSEDSEMNALAIMELAEMLLGG